MIAPSWRLLEVNGAYGIESLINFIRMKRSVVGSICGAIVNHFCLTLDILGLQVDWYPSRYILLNREA